MRAGTPTQRRQAQPGPRKAPHQTSGHNHRRAGHWAPKAWLVAASCLLGRPDLSRQIVVTFRGESAVRQARAGAHRAASQSLQRWKALLEVGGGERGAQGELERVGRRRSKSWPPLQCGAAHVPRTCLSTETQGALGCCGNLSPKCSASPAFRRRNTMRCAQRRRDCGVPAAGARVTATSNASYNKP